MYSIYTYRFFIEQALRAEEEEGRLFATSQAGHKCEHAALEEVGHMTELYQQICHQELALAIDCLVLLARLPGPNPSGFYLHRTEMDPRHRAFPLALLIYIQKPTHLH